MSSEEDVAKLIERWGGKAGGPDTETVVCSNKEDRKDGYVRVWSSIGADVARIAKRCGSVMEFEDDGYGVWMKIPTKYFRGPEYCFKRVDNKVSKE